MGATIPPATFQPSTCPSHFAAVIYLWTASLRDAARPGSGGDVMYPALPAAINPPPDNLNTPGTSTLKSRGNRLGPFGSAGSAGGSSAPTPGGGGGPPRMRPLLLSGRF